MVQVASTHYHFESYESPERFTSYYFQVKAAMSLAPESLLEIGGGSGAFAALTQRQGISVLTMDIDHELNPTVVGSVLNIPLANSSVDVCAAFQVLEHLPFESFGVAIAELARVARKGVLLSLPEIGNAGMVVNLPFVRKLRFAGRVLLSWYPKHSFDGQHYWEINKIGYPRHVVIAKITQNNLELTDCWLNPYNPYHRFFILRKRT